MDQKLLDYGDRVNLVAKHGEKEDASRIEDFQWGTNLKLHYKNMIDMKY